MRKGIEGNNAEEQLPSPRRSAAETALRSSFDDIRNGTPDIEQTYTPGDINNDGNINNIDVTLALKHMTGSKILTGDPLKAANYDVSSGDINLRDVIAIIKKK